MPHYAREERHEETNPARTTMLRLRLAVVAIVLVEAGCDARANGPPLKAGSGGAANGEAGIDSGSGNPEGGSHDGTLEGGRSGSGTDAGGPGSDMDASVDSRRCGNGFVDADEQCDDGNTKNGDGCDNNCLFSCTVEHAELCSDHNVCNGAETCSDEHVCLPSKERLQDGVICGVAQKCNGGRCVDAPTDCGDGLVEKGEECDDSNGVDGDGCDDCMFSCSSTEPARNCRSADPCPGNAQCDDRTHTCKAGTPLADLTSCGEGKACIGGVCTDHYCGNGAVDTGEECDDGNQTDDDGCERTCKFTCVATDAARDCHSDNSCIIGGTCDSQTHRCSPSQQKPAGTACAGGGNCVYGNCLKAVCGDGIVAQNIETCDDGNQVDGDGCDRNCKASCTLAATDCVARTPICQTATCAAGVCSSTASQEGNVCSTTAGKAVCKAGACTAGVCGNGTIESGETCDDGNKVGGDGCETSCQPSCLSNAGCDDGDPCNGLETCIAVSGTAGAKKCTRTAALKDGTACGTKQICLRGSCRPSFCGDSFTDASVGEECDPPNNVGCDSKCKAEESCDPSGTWAVKTDLTVSWGGDTGVLEKGTGEIDQWALLSVNPTSSGTAFTAMLKPCALIVPDFHSMPQYGGEWYGLTFPDAAFDSSKMPIFDVEGTLSNLVPGAALAIRSTAVSIGLSIVPPATSFDPWPAAYTDLIPANGYTTTDVDQDGHPGITALAKTGARSDGAPYMGIIYDINSPHTIDNPGRATKLYLAIRQITSLTGKLESCNLVTGSMNGTNDNHVLGCLTDTGAECASTSAKADLLDYVRPIYNVLSGTFSAARLDASKTCAAVRAKVP